MPPKASAKSANKQKQKIIEDKTFGLKNKNRSAKVNRYVQQVESQVHAAGNRKERQAAEARKLELERKKKEEAARKAELAELFKPIVQQQKVPFGVDPKSVLCAFFKAGQCQKGAKCKFSHDLNIERKVQKVDIYTDPRDKQQQETMEDWDQEKLEKAVNEKHGSTNQNKPTEIVCKFFLEAIEERKYGYFWNCPNGSKCKYRHALPPGFVLKKKETEEERRAREEAEKENEISIEEFLETERHNLGPNLTPVTAESFAKWKRERKERAAKEAEQEAKKRAEEFKKMKAGMKTGMSFSGKELFDFNPEWVQDGDNDAGGAVMENYEREERDDEEEGNEDTNNNNTSSSTQQVVNEDLFANEDLEGLDDDDDEDDEEEEQEENNE